LCKNITLSINNNGFTRCNISSDLKLEKQRINEKDIFTSITQVHKRVRGAYAAVGMIPGYGIFGFRDPNGIRVPPFVVRFPKISGRMPFGSRKPKIP
jgi:glutamine phosphoribosylpyrophosphate amidotransferase